MSSEYEQNVGKLLAKKTERLEELMKNPEQNRGEIAMLSTEVETLQSLFENYNFAGLWGGDLALENNSALY
jgi:hypothetical protein